jgi:hypothetical protein
VGKSKEKKGELAKDREGLFAVDYLGWDGHFGGLVSKI